MISFCAVGPRDNLPRKNTLTPGPQPLSGLPQPLVHSYHLGVPYHWGSCCPPESWVPAHTFLERAISTITVVSGGED